MPITTNCPGCGKTIAAPDSAAGRKAHCPHCGAVMDIPAGGTAMQELAAALGRPAHAAVDEAGGPDPVDATTAVATPPAAEQALTPPSSGLRATTPRSSGSTSASRTSATTIDRMFARTSPYKSLRLLAAITFGVGAVLAVLVGVAGLVSLILVSLGGYPLIGVGVFVGAIVVAAGIFLGARIFSEMLGLWADLGDRMRQMMQLLEDSLARPKDNGV
jgi:hypothetical protein